MIKCGRGMCKHAKCSLQQAVSRTGEGDLQPSNHQQTRSLSFSVASSSLIASTPCLTLTNHSRDKLQPGRSCWGVQQRSIVTKARSRTHLYDVLGITPKASQAEIKTAYYRLSKMHHPDIDKNEGANVRFGEISEAYEVLGNVNRRRMYDHGAFQGGRSSSGHATPQEEEEDYTRPFREQEGFGTERQAPPTGRTQQYNFDEFYRQHYSEQIRQKQAGINYWKEMEREADHDRTQSLIRTIVTGSMLLALIVTFFGLDKTPGRKTMTKKD